MHLQQSDPNLEDSGNSLMGTDQPVKRRLNEEDLRLLLPAWRLTLLSMFRHLLVLPFGMPR